MKRYAPGRPFVARAFVPGYTPDPRRDPDSAARPPEYAEELLEPRSFWRCERYLYGIDLWNHGYYWEAHEAWEGLWHAAGRTGAIGALLKGLIRLAAAGVKVRQGNPESVGRHGEGARLQFRSAQELCGQPLLCGLDLAALVALAERITARQQRWRGDPELPCQVVFDRPLTLIP